MDRRTLPTLPLLLVLLVLPACGGGGGGGAPAATVLEHRLEGAYGHFAFEVLTANLPATPNEARVLWGQATADRNAGTIDSLLAANQTGFTSLGVLRTNESYAPLPAGRVRIGDYVGAASPGGAEVAALAAEAGSPGLTILVKRATEASPSLADVAGDYHLALFEHDDATDLETITFGSVRLDGAGVVTNVTTRSNTGGVASLGSTAPDGTYAVDDDHAIGLDVLGLRLSGVYLGSGELIVLAGPSDASLSRQMIGFLVRMTSASTDATLAGTYDTAAIYTLRRAGSPSTSDHYGSSLATLIMDGAGTSRQSGEVVSNLDGQTSRHALPPIDSTYSVLPIGVFTLGTSGTIGYLTADGRFAVLVTGAGGGLPAISLMIRVD